MCRPTQVPWLALVALALAAGAAGHGSTPASAPDDPAWAAKLDPFLRRVALGTLCLRDGHATALPAASATLVRSLPGFVRRTTGLAGPRLHVQGRIVEAPGTLEALDDLGVEIRGRVGEIVSLRLAPAVLGAVAALPEVRWLEASRTYELTNEVGSGPAHVASRAANLLGFTGSGVIVAVVDTGIDWAHPDFRNPDGTTRILGIWDQTAGSGTHPPPAAFGFGAYYDRADIDAALEGDEWLGTTDVHGHGTHVAGTAAGNGRQTGNGVPAGTFAGVAPEADLLVVKVFEGTSAQFCDECDLTAAVQFIRDFAAAAGRPWVGNMSLGHNIGPHDGTDPDELAIAAAVGPGIRGSQMAIAAGNMGATSRHFHWVDRLIEGQTLTNAFDLPGGPTEGGSENDEIWLDLWYDSADRLTFEVETPGGEVVSAASGTDSGIVCSTSGAIQIDATNSPDPANGDGEVFVQIWDSETCAPLVIEPQPGSWTLRITADVVASDAGIFDLWNAASTRGLSYVDLDVFDLASSVSMPGTSRRALTAGSYVSKDHWINADNQTTGPCCGTTPVGTRSSFSGIGPTRDGRIKPDVAAPGEWVGSSLSGADASPPSGDFRERDGEHGNIRGTSMATPHVAGTAALLLSVNPDLDGSQVLAALTRAARGDGLTGTTPNNLWGHGKLRALEAVYEAAAMVTDLTAATPTGFGGTGNALIAWYNVYRATLDDLRQKSYGHCLETQLPSPAFTDADLPPAGTSYFYLVSGVYLHPGTGVPVEGILGTNSKGQIRGNRFPCP